MILGFKMTRIHWVWIAGGYFSFFWIFIIHPSDQYIYSDMRIMLQTARNITLGNFPSFDVHYPSGYPLLIASVMGFFKNYFFWLKVLHGLFYIIAIVGFTLGARNLYGEKVAFWTACVLSVHFPLHSASGFLLAEVPFTAVLALAFYTIAMPMTALKLKRLIVCGFLLGIAFWIKGTGVLIAPILSVWILCGDQDIIKTKCLKAGALLGGFVLPIILLHGFYSSFYHLDKWMPSNGATNWIEGKCPSKNNYDSTGVHFLSPINIQQGNKVKKVWDRPFSESSYYWREGWRCIEERPIVIVESGMQVLYLFIQNVQWPDGNTRFSKWMTIWGGVTGWILLLLFSLSCLVALCGDRSVWSYATIIPIIALFMCVWIIKAEIRYRIPFDGFLIIISIVLAERLWGAEKSKRIRGRLFFSK